MQFFAQNVVILGAGLLGGSLGMAMRQRNLAAKVSVWSPSESTRAACAKTDWCGTVYSSPEEACQEADFVIFCGPVDTIPPLMKRLAPICRPDCLLTDVGSTKARICAAGDQYFSGSRKATFIGSHPMAGSEKSGLPHAEAKLFEGKTCILTPADAPLEPLRRLRSFWSALGMTLFECLPEEHDRIVAQISHLPHALAAALCANLSDHPAEWKDCAGSGLRDSSRIAAGDPRLWSAIFRENESAFRESLSNFRKALAELESALDEKGDESLLQFLTKARDYRIQLNRGNSCDE